MDQDFRDAVVSIIDQYMRDNIHTSAPAKVGNVSENFTAELTPDLKVTTDDDREVPYPKISGTAILMPTGAGGTIGFAFPVHSGDGCVAIFGEGGSGTDLKWDLSNATLLPGLPASSSEQVKRAGSEDAAVVFAPTATITVKKDCIELKKQDTTITLKDSSVFVQRGGSNIEVTDGSTKITTPLLDVTGNTEIKGNIQVQGNVNISGTLVLGGIVMNTHTHATSGEVGTYAESSSVTKKMTVSSYDDAYSQMLAAVQSFDALVKFGIAVSDETDDQGEHSIVLTASGAADSFSATLCKYITVTEVTSNIQFESAEYGSYVLADGVITQIVTTVDGWTACTNDIAPIKGRLTQTDAEARTSYTNRVASRGTGTVASIVSLLYSDVDGVTFAAGYENYNDTTDAAGRPPHSIEIVVQGGSDEDVANIIWKNKAGGIRAYGKHYAYATDINGNRQYLEFTRVNDVYLLLSVTVTSSGGLDDDYAARIKSLLMEEILSAGTTIRLQTFIRPIMESVSGVDYVEIRGLLSEKPDIEGVADNSMLTGIVPVEINQQPVLSMSGIRVVKA